MRVNLFEIGPIKVHSYGLLIGIGILAAFYMAEKRAGKKGLDADKIFNLGIWCAIGGLLGAKLLFFIVEFDSIMASGDILHRVAVGFVVYGGIIVGILAGWLYCKRNKMPFLKYFDLVMPSIALAQGFGRIGCFLAGCCYGRETDSIFGVVFPENTPYAPSGVKLIPTQLISSGADFLHCIILVVFANKAKKDGQVASLYLILYSIGRFLIEFLRNDERGSVSQLSTSQFIAIFTLAAGVALFVFCTKKKQKALSE